MEDHEERAPTHPAEEPIGLPEPTVEEIESDWGDLSCGCECDWG